MRTTFGCIGAVLSISAIAVWFYLLYQLLSHTEGISLAVWTAYWVYVPLSAIAVLIGRGVEFSENIKKDQAAK